LAFTRYCRFQYRKIYIAIQGGRGETIYCATEWAMKGGSGVPKQKDVCKEYYGFVYKNDEQKNIL